MDLVGYSLLNVEEQKRRLELLQEAVKATGTFTRIPKGVGLLPLPTGDGMALVFFLDDPEAPLRCAIEIGRELKRFPELGLRMGIHRGPVFRLDDINGNANVAGAGINGAQRVMDCGDAGHISGFGTSR